MCAHRAGWTRVGGEARCDRCGTRRFTDYGALRPPGMPVAVTPSPESGRAADRAAARWVAARQAARLLPRGPGCAHLPVRR
ncbi:DUF6255 family natural product biosynthesis protein [Streptomyces triculaminicus]|uniref:DUF6255 family natural product biosynthesis protein n=1 Tax=Streptomyces triculaminicus TaxID=2816232 RepID=UPI0033E41543